MDKETEIKHLQALRDGDTYFAQFFSKSDVAKMIENIKNDFPIEMGCAFVAKAEALEKALKETKQGAEQAKFDMAVEIYKSLDENVPTDLQNVVMNFLGDPLRFIEAKVAANVPPTREEVEFLIRQAKNNNL